MQITTQNSYFSRENLIKLKKLYAYALPLDLLVVFMFSCPFVNVRKKNLANKNAFRLSFILATSR